MTDYLNTYAWNDHKKLAVLHDKEGTGNLKLSLYDEQLEKTVRTGVPRDSREVVWLGNKWGVLVSNDEGFEIHSVTFN